MMHRRHILTFVSIEIDDLNTTALSAMHFMFD